MAIEYLHVAIQAAGQSIAGQKPGSDNPIPLKIRRNPMLSKYEFEMNSLTLES